MSGGKGGQQTSTVELPPEVKAQALENMDLAKQVGSLPYAPYFGGSVAAFQPSQQAGFNNMNSAAAAFGLQGGAGQGMPKSKKFGGVNAYSTEDVYKDALSRVPKDVLKLYESFFYPNAGFPSSGGGSGGSTAPSGSQGPITQDQLPWYLRSRS